MKCPACGAAELVADCRDITRQVDGITTTVPNVHGHFCPACGECVLDPQQGDRHAAAIRLAELGGQAPDMANIPRRRVD